MMSDPPLYNIFGDISARFPDFSHASVRHYNRSYFLLAIQQKIVISCSQTIFFIYYFITKGNSLKRGYMDPKLVKQFIFFLIFLFGWTIVILLAGPK